MSLLNEKDFLSEIELLVQATRREIEAFKLGLDPDKKAIAQRRRRVLVDKDFRFFAYTYFPHHIRGEPSTFQDHFCNRFPRLLDLTTGVREFWVAPRGETKSSLLTKIGPVWVAVQGLLQRPDIRAELAIKKAPDFMDYIMLFGAETRMPTKLLEVVKTELVANSSLALDFPEACGRGPVWKVGDMVTRTGVKVEPFGAEQAMRGTFHGASRPKLLLGDDLITDKEAKSPTERENRWDWLEKAVDYLGPPDGTVKFLGVGTILNKDDLISRAKQSVGYVVHHFKAIEKFPDNMHLWDKCEEIMRNDDPKVIKQYGKRGEIAPENRLPSNIYWRKNKKRMSKGAFTSWPDVRSLYWLMKQRAKNRKAFATEMQGEPRTDEDRVFTDIRFWVHISGRWVHYGACDPSMGKGETSDPSAILVGGYDMKKLQLNVIHAEIKRRLPSKLQADLIAAQKEFGCQGWAFENNNAYEHMRKSFVDAAKLKQVVLPLVGITAIVPPEVRIDSLEPNINDMEPDILFHPKLIALLDELRDWPEKQPNHHYDGLTALHLLYHIAVTRAGGLPQITSKGASGRTRLAGY